MSTETFPPEPYDPDRIPHANIDMLGLRYYISKHRSLEWSEDATDRIRAYRETYRSQIVENLSKLSSSKSFDAKPFAIISMLVAIGKEKPAEIEPVLTSLGETIDATEMHDPHSQVITMPWLNYTADPRREHTHADQLHNQAQTMARRAIEIVAPSGRPKSRVVTGIDRIPKDTAISHLRNKALQGTLGILPGSDLDVPYVMLDADTTLSPNALTVINDTLEKGRSLFVNGTLHHVGGVMDMLLDKLYFADTGSKMLYIIEMLRRAMMDHLPPQAARGYPAESGLATRLDTLVNLGGYDANLHNNESYDLLSKAERALTTWFDIDHFRNTTTPRSSAKLPNHKPFPEPYVNLEAAERISSLVEYADYTVSTSIRGYETAIRRHGLQILARFDQGFEYELYTHTPEADHDGPLSTELLTLEKAIELLNKSYSYFEDCGGVLLAKDLGDIERLLYMCFAKRYADAPSPHAVWRPEYIPKEQRM